MQGLITIDFGNSHPHAGLFQKNLGNWELVKVVPWTELSLYTTQVGMNPDNSQLALAEVKAREEELKPFLEQGYLLTRVKEYWRGERFHGMPVNYARTLGEDRLINAFYCWKREKIPTLLIDAGTFTTFDVVSVKGFEGGYILPGIKSYFSLFQQGEQLKDIELTPSLTSDLPHTTAEAMSSGYEAFRLLALELIKRYGIEKIIFTGGQSSLWENLLRPVEIRTEIDNHLIHRAIHFWMTTQIEPL